jgi:hypothetical protein
MIRRGWILALSTGASLGLLPGCLRPRVDHIPPDLFSQIDAAGPPLSRGASPYHPRTEQVASPRQGDSAIPQTTPTTSTSRVPTGPQNPPPPPVESPPSHKTQEPDPGVVRASVAPDPVRPEPGLAPEPLFDALRCYRNGRPDEALKRLNGYHTTTREMLATLLPLAVRLSERGADRTVPRELLPSLLDQLEQLTALLRARAALAITEGCFCRSIHRFGEFDPWPADHAFRVGAAGRWGEYVQVYVELQNFSCQKKGDFYETALAATFIIRDRDTREEKVRLGKAVEIDRRRSRPHDCFLNCHFYVPPNIPPGPYLLEIEVRDVTGLASGQKVPGHRIAHRTLDLQLQSDRYVSTPAPGPMGGNLSGQNMR